MQENTITLTEKPNSLSHPLTIWLFFCAFMVFAMMLIGAITRLTESGLSMVEWRPLIGSLPPLSEAEWQRVFALYQESPEYQQKNFWMGIDDFKTIFFWEWFHRLWGRLIGIAFALPLIFFWVKKMVPSGYHLKLFGLLILGGLQGLMGWYMVQSGLVDLPAVSHYRLASHLSLAFIILGALLWLAFDFAGMKRQTSDAKLKIHAVLTLCVLGITIVWGAFTAGLDGGLIYNSWPMMGEHWIPAEITTQNSLQAKLNNPAGVQFVHRWLAIIAALVIFSLVAHSLIKNQTNTWVMALGFITILQVGLGIATLISGVNIVLATLHQAGAALLFASLIGYIFVITPRQQAALKA